MSGYKALTLFVIVLALSACSEDSSNPEQKNVPQLLQATAGDGEVALSWVAVNGASGYTLYWDTEQNETTSLSKYTGQPITLSETNYVHDNLNNGSNYRYVVTATTSNGESSESNLAEARPQRTPPAKPGSVLIKAEDERITLRWSGVSRAERYDLIWDTNNTFPNPRRIQDIKNPYVHTGLSNGQVVYYQLLAVNPGGEIASDPLSATPNPRLPSAPTGLGITAQDSAINLGWSDVSNAGSYDLFWSMTPGVNTQDNLIRGITSPYTHAPLINGQTYYYRLRARNAAGSSALSGEMQATVNSAGSEVLPTVGTPPQVPAGVILETSDGQLDITWQLRQGASGYNLYWATESSPGVAPSITIQSSKIANISPPYTHMGLSNGERYYYRVSAINDSGESPLTPMASQVPEVLQPGVPSNVTAIGGDGFIAIRWNRVRDAQIYTLYYWPEGGTATVVPNLGESLYQINGLNNGTVYHLQVTSTNSQSGESPRSAELLVTPQVDPVAAPVGVRAIPGDAEVELQFDVSAYSGLTAGKAVQAYRIYTSTIPGVLASDNFVNIDATGIAGATASFTHANLTNGRRYYYTVTALNAGGESPLSREVWAQPQLAVPGAPQNFQITEAGNELTLVWQEPAGIPPTNYNVYWSQTLSNGQRTQPVVIPNVGNQVSPGRFQYTVTGLINNTHYFVHVKAFNEGGESLSSTELGAVPHVIAPTGVATALSAQAESKQVTVSWDWDSSTQGATPPHYRLYWSTQATMDLQNSPWIDAVQSGYIHQDLSNGQTYYYRVAAQNDGGIGPVSSLIQAMPLPDAPGQVSGLQVQGSDQAVILSWEDVPGADNYFVYWTTNPAQPMDSWNQLSGMNSGDQHQVLTNGTTYYYVVTAANLGGESDSSQVAIATPQLPAPVAPRGLSVTADNTRVILDWATEVGLTYNIYWVNNATDDPFTQGQVFNDVRPAYSHTGLTNDSVYRYVVTANNAGGESAPSQELRATPQALQTGAPRTLAAQAGDGQVSLSWQPAPAATANTRYTLYVGDATGTGTSGTAITNVSSPYVHSGLDNGTQYYYVVTATEDVESAPSNEANAQPLPPTPAVPTGLLAIAGDSLVNLSWNATQNTSSYTLHWDTVSDFSSASSIPLGLVRTYQHTDRNNGSTYYYRLQAHNGPANSAYSYIVSATPVSPVVNTPPQVQITSPSGDVAITVGESVDFQLNAADAEDDAVGRPLTYQWDFGSGSGIPSSQLQDPGIRRFQVSGIYTVTVTATDSEGSSSSTSREITVNANQAPDSSITLPAQDVFINIGDSVTFSGQGQDNDNHLPLSYHWRFGNSSGINDSDQPAPGTQTFTIAGTYVVQFTVTDGLGLRDPTPAAITVRVNTPPSVQIDSPAQDAHVVNMDEDNNPTAFVPFVINANDPEGTTMTWSIAPLPSPQPQFGTPSFSNIAANGSTATLEYTVNPDEFGTDTFDVRVTDAQGGFTDLSVEVRISGQNDLPTIQTNQLTINQGQTLILNSISGAPNLETADVDNTPSELIYRIINADNGQFELTANPGTPITSFNHQQVLDGSVAFAHFDGSPAPAYGITVEDLSGIASATNVALIDFNGTDITPDPFPFDPQFDVPPNTTVFSNTITVTGINRSVPISIVGGAYSINGGNFTTDAGTVAAGQQVRVQHTASPLYFRSTAADLTISDVVSRFSVRTAQNQAPVINTTSPISANENSSSTGYIPQATDPEGHAISFSVSGTDALLFEIGLNNELLFASRLDFETPLDANQDNVYELNVVATDELNLASQLALTVTVLDETSRLVFDLLTPMPGSEVGRGYNTRTTVSGRFLDLESGPLMVNSATANGVAMAETPIGSGVWTAPIDVLPGNNTLDVSAVIQGEALPLSSQSIFSNNGAMRDPRGISIDASANRAYVIDGGHEALLSINLTTGVREVISDSRIGTGTDTSVFWPNKTLLHTNNTRIYVSDSWGGGPVWDIDLATGDRVSIGTSSSAAGLALDPTRNRLLVTNGWTGIRGIDLTTNSASLVSATTDSALITDVEANSDYTQFIVSQQRNLSTLQTMDPVTGNRVSIASDTVGSGASIVNSRSVTWHPTNNLIWVGDANGVVEVDLDTLARTRILSTDYQVYEVALDAANNRLLLADAEHSAIRAMSLADNSESTFSEGAIGSGPGFSYPRTSAIDASKGWVYIAEFSSIFRVNLSNGNRTLVPGSGTTAIAEPYSMVVDSQNDMLYFSAGSADAASIYRLDAKTGTAVTLAGSTIDGPNFDSRSIVVDFPGQTAWVINIQQLAIIQVDLTNGNRVILSDSLTGTGAPFTVPTSIAMDTTRNRLLVADGDRIVAVALNTGNRTMVSDVNNNGPIMNNSNYLSYDPIGDRLFLINNSSRLLSVDLSTGDRTVVSAVGVVGTGPRFNRPISVNVDPGKNRLFVMESGDGTTALTSISISTGDRTIVSQKGGRVLF